MILPLSVLGSYNLLWYLWVAVNVCLYPVFFRYLYLLPRIVLYPLIARVCVCVCWPAEFFNKFELLMCFPVTWNGNGMHTHHRSVSGFVPSVHRVCCRHSVRLEPASRSSDQRVYVWSLNDTALTFGSSSSTHTTVCSSNWTMYNANARQRTAQSVIVVTNHATQLSFQNNSDPASHLASKAQFESEMEKRLNKIDSTLVDLPQWKKSLLIQHNWSVVRCHSHMLSIKHNT